MRPGGRTRHLYMNSEGEIRVSLREFSVSGEPTQKFYTTMKFLGEFVKNVLHSTLPDDCGQ